MRINYNSIYAAVCCICVFSNPVFGQWQNSFESNDLSEWGGDVSVFTVNEQSQLQLNASAAGDAFLFRSSEIYFDTVSFSLYHLLDFAPSDNNQSTIYLALDNSDVLNASGYFIQIGENGSDDAIEFYYLNNGSEELIASGSMGAMAEQPAIVRLQIDVFPDGLWSVKTNYREEGFTSLELEFLDDRFPLLDSKFFALSCTYSASRADKFYYDDLSMTRFIPDIQPPEVFEALAVKNGELLVTFSEPVIESDALNPINYALNNAVGVPDSIATFGLLGNQFVLFFNQGFDASLTYEIEVGNIYDFNGNKMVSQSIPFVFADFPKIGELLISEILFDPYPGGEDFVEVFNASSNYLRLEGVEVHNRQNETFEVLGSYVLAPNAYLAFSENISFLLEEYEPPNEAYIVKQDLPALNNDSGNITLVSLDGISLDSMEYEDDQHFILLDDTEGVSLERLSFEIEASVAENWQSASESVRFATPGYPNSNRIPMSSLAENFQLVKEVFSPNQDGEDDLMVLQYQLDKAGYVATISVYDAAGYLIKTLSNNELLGTQGVITWDGTTEDAILADLGIYIVAGKVFHENGETIHLKLTTVLADFID